MKLTLFWQDMWQDGILCPIAYISETPQNLKGCLCGLLMEHCDVGNGINSLFLWVGNSLKQIQVIKKNNSKFTSLSTESWTANISKEKVKIYFNYTDDENYFDEMSFDSFEKSLFAWRDFLQTEPDLNNKVEVEI